MHSIKNLYQFSHQTDISQMGNSPYNHMYDINITQNGEKKLRKDLNPDKISDPDDLTPKILKELYVKFHRWCTMYSASRWN